MHLCCMFTRLQGLAFQQNWWQYYATKPDEWNSRWRPPNRKCIYLCYVDWWQRDSYGLHMFLKSSNQIKPAQYFQTEETGSIMSKMEVSNPEKHVLEVWQSNGTSDILYDQIRHVELPPFLQMPSDSWALKNIDIANEIALLLSWSEDIRISGLDVTMLRFYFPVCAMHGVLDYSMIY